MAEEQEALSLVPTSPRTGSLAMSFLPSAGRPREAGPKERAVRWRQGRGSAGGKAGWAFEGFLTSFPVVVQSNGGDLLGPPQAGSPGAGPGAEAQGKLW